MVRRRYYNALSGLMARRGSPAARAIIDDALEAAESALIRLLDVDLCEFLQATRRARQTQEPIEIMGHDSRGMPVVVHIQPEQLDGEDRLTIQVRYLRHRLFQMVGEFA